MKEEKRLKKYADEKMNKFKDDEFVESLSDAHFDDTSSKKFSWKYVRAIAVSLVAVFIVVLSTVIAITQRECNSELYSTIPSSVSQMNLDFDFVQFADIADAEVNLIVLKDTDVKQYYFVKVKLNGDADLFTFVCVINEKEYPYDFGEFEQSRQFGDCQIGYEFSIENGESESSRYRARASLITDKEKIDIHYEGESALNADVFFDMLSSILTSK